MPSEKSTKNDGADMKQDTTAPPQLHRWYSQHPYEEPAPSQDSASREGQPRASEDQRLRENEYYLNEMYRHVGAGGGQTSSREVGRGSDSLNTQANVRAGTKVQEDAASAEKNSAEYYCQGVGAWQDR
ncbi:MAG: hypothetical protein Q9227_009503 [Pyrenula ochraceoflavens]